MFNILKYKLNTKVQDVKNITHEVFGDSVKIKFVHSNGLYQFDFIDFYDKLRIVNKLIEPV